jgi:hypothetical protein
MCNQKTCDETNPCNDPPHRDYNQLFLIALFSFTVSCCSGICIGFILFIVTSNNGIFGVIREFRAFLERPRSIKLTG